MKKQFYITTLLLSTALISSASHAVSNDKIALSSPLTSCPANPDIDNTTFYPGKKNMGASNNLLHNVGSGFNAKGQTIQIKGRVLDTFCQPVTGALVEIWQADADGDIGIDRDPHFVGSGKAYTNNMGIYTFTTVLPGQAEANEAPYLNFAVTHPQMKGVNTVMFFPDHPLNKEDELYHGMIDSGFKEPAARASAPEEFEFNISVQGLEDFKEL
jgi:protocatechuate 3,4-dioxygenase beta subunit